MPQITRRSLLAGFALAGAVRGADEWVPLFDGRTLEGWTPNESPGSWSVRDGSIAADGPRSHLFYTGPVRGADFKNFELKFEVMTRPLANSGVFFHTKTQPSGWPAQGFELQVANTALGAGSYRERKKTGSLYGVRNVYKAFARDDEWFELHAIVAGKRVQTFLNGMPLVDYVEPTPPFEDPEGRGRFLQRGTFALQCHDPGSKVFFRNFRVKPLPDDLPSPPPPKVDELYKAIRTLGSRNYPMVDYHVHLKGGWTIEDALRNSRETGIGYGVAVNCGRGFPVQDDAGAEAFLKSMERYPVFVAMQAEGREWVKTFSPATVAKFDYVFTDAMTFEHNGRRLRLWLPDELGDLGDHEKFMDVIVSQIVGVLEREPIDIYVNPTFLPDAMAPEYDRLWTDARIERVIAAAAKSGVGLEINARYRIPSPKIIRAAKAAGLKFAFGTNNVDANLGRLEYPIRMVQECGLAWADIFVPGQKRNPGLGPKS